jgi:hypothetical protein
MLLGMNDLTVTALLSALLHPGEDPAGMRFDLFRAFARWWHRPVTGRRPQPPRAFPSRRRTDLELPASAAGRADRSVPGRPWRPQTRLRKWREGGGERRVTLSPQGIAFSRALPPSVDEPDPGTRRYAPAYPLMADLPGAYYVLSGVGAGRRWNGR